MEPRTESLVRRRRRRKRRHDRIPISAHLLLDERLKEDVGVLSEDLFADLFPGNSRLLGMKSCCAVVLGIALTDYPKMLKTPKTNRDKPFDMSLSLHGYQLPLYPRQACHGQYYQ
jgi:hypothetical protein